MHIKQKNGRSSSAFKISYWALVKSVHFAWTHFLHVIIIVFPILSHSFGFCSLCTNDILLSYQILLLVLWMPVRNYKYPCIQCKTKPVKSNQKGIQFQFFSFRRSLFFSFIQHKQQNQYNKHSSQKLDTFYFWQMANKGAPPLLLVRCGTGSPQKYPSLSQCP